MARKEKTPLTVATLVHEEATRTNIPTAEHQSVMADEQQHPIQVAYQRRNRDLDRAAMQAARKWRFNPSMVNGQPAAGRVRVPVDFNLGG